jgi:myosin-5
MVRQGTSQSLVINGESGAGKTETTKKAMQFFAALAGGTGVEGQVLEVRRCWLHSSCMAGYP